MAVKTVEERLTVVEHKVAENASGIERLHAAIIDLGDRMERRLDGMEQRFDRRFEAVDRRFEAIDRRFEAADRRFEKMEQTTSTHFRWIVGIQMTTLLTMVAAMAALAAAALDR